MPLLSQDDVSYHSDIKSDLEKAKKKGKGLNFRWVKDDLL